MASALKCLSVSSKRFPVLQNSILPLNENSVCCCSTQKALIGGFVVAAGLGFVPFKKHESVLDVQQELDKICKWITASQFTSIWSTSI